jgi:hypothetical protein
MPSPDVRPATPALERFARETLGCQCAPEVFQQVTDDPLSLPGLPEPARRIAFGGRLLVYLCPVTNATVAATRIADWVAAGLADRDRRGMNRLRLVLTAASWTTTAAGAIQAAFTRLPGLDERVHLHLIPAQELDAIVPRPPS